SVNELASRERAIAVIGPLLSDTAEAGAAQAQKLRVPIITLSQREGLTEIGNYVFRNGLTNSVQVRAVARYAVTELGLHTFSILYPDDRYGAELSKFFQDEVSKLSGRVPVAISYSPGQTNFGEEISRIKANSEIEGLFIPDGFETVSVIAPQLAYYEVKRIRLIGVNAWNSPKLVEKSGPSVSGAVFSDAFFVGSRNPITRRFVEDYVAAYGEDPDLLAAHGYDTARMISEILARETPHAPGAGMTNETMRAALAQVRDFSGVTGVLSFSDSRDAVAEPMILSVQGSHIVQVR
ncbi:MAG: ABC transporter substrate-binding protein, partial [Vicinamibacteria bacterium]